MNLLQVVVQIAGLVALWCVFLAAVWYGFMKLVERGTVRVLTEDEVRAELSRLNEQERVSQYAARERRRLIRVPAKDDAAAANWLAKDAGWPDAA